MRVKRKACERNREKEIVLDRDRNSVCMYVCVKVCLYVYVMCICV